MGKRIDSKYLKDEVSGRQGNNHRNFVIQCIYLATSITLGFFLVKYTEATYGELDKEAILAIYTSIFLYILCNYLQVALHEAGHLLFGLLTGYQFLSIRFYSLTLVRRNGKLSCKKLSIPGTGGQCLMIPPRENGLEAPCFLYNLGGIIMNFLTALVAILTLFLMPELPLFFGLLLIVFTASGILCGILNGLPARFIGMANDGYNVRALAKDQIARRSFRLQLMITERQYNGIRLKDLPTEWFELPVGADRTNVMNAHIIFAAYNRELDRLDYAAAELILREIELLLPKLPESFRNSVDLNLIYLSLINGESREKVKQLLTKQTKSLLKSPKNEINLRRIAYAYYLLYEENDKEAGKALVKLKELARKYPVTAEAEMNLILAEQLQNRRWVTSAENAEGR